jgi:hypothetical protein
MVGIGGLGETAIPSQKNERPKPDKLSAKYPKPIAKHGRASLRG